MTEGKIAIPEARSLDTTILETPTIEPTERSIPPDMITKVMPRAMIPFTEVCLTKFRMLFVVKKFFVAKERIMMRKITITNKFPSTNLDLFLENNFIPVLLSSCFYKPEANRSKDSSLKSSRETM